MRTLIDTKCRGCLRETIDAFVETTMIPQCEACGETVERMWKANPAGVLGDEIDVTVKHGLCNADGSPRRFRSRAEMKRVADSLGLRNHVEHVPTKGSDKSPHTQRFF